jgi:hypothetical protein
MMMNRTAFPATPDEVAALTPQEFTFDLDDLDGITPRRWTASAGPSWTTRIGRWSGGFRFGALKAWCARTDVMARLNSGSMILQDARDVAASFPLNTSGNSNRPPSIPLSRR